MHNSNLCSAQNRWGKECMAPVAEGAPLSMCMKHLMIAGEWWAEVKPLVNGAAMLRNKGLEDFFNLGDVFSRRDVGHAAPPTETSPPVVYYLLHGSRIKIGTSRAWRKRVRQHPHDRVLAIEPGGFDVEARRHRQFASLRVGASEWFDEDADLWDHIMDVNDANPQYDRVINAHNADRAASMPHRREA